MNIRNFDFVHLRTQTSYSMLESSLKVKDIISLAQKYKMPAVAVADRNNLFSSLEFSLEAKSGSIQPINACLLNILYHDSKGEECFGEIVAIASNKEGYSNLLKLGSYPYINNSQKSKPHITFDDLVNNNQGIILLSGYVDGPIGRELLVGDTYQAENYAKKLLKVFGDRFYFEIMRHYLADEQKIERDYINLAKKLDIPIVATNKVLFQDVKMHYAHDVLLCIADGVVKDSVERRMVSNQCYFKSQKEMKELFADIPSAIINTEYIARRCSISSSSSDPMLPSFSDENFTEEELLRQESEHGLKKRLEHMFETGNYSEDEKSKIKQTYSQRLEYELSIICSMNFAGYFLIVSDFIKWSKENNIYVGPGRGSGAGSIVAWSLLITDLDPIRFGLIFERFLNPERISMPDFDIDFCQERREEVINYVRNKYSDDRVGQIITFGKLQAKAVIKDVARVLSLRYEIADYLTDLVPFNAVNPVTLSQAVKEVAELKQAYQGKGLYNHQDENELIKQVLEVALSLEGVHRHCSVHAAGVVISGSKLIETLPLYKDTNGEMLIVQYSMKYAELAGLVKFDFLGLQTLTVISKCLDLLKNNGVNVDLSKISFKDTKTYDMLSRGSSIGVFQFESAGMRDTLKKLKPDCVEDLIALGALYRPGPMDNIPTYIACKHKKQEPTYIHPLLEDTLKETYGVIVYQEQVLEIARILAGYSLGSADLLRRAMGKKIKSEMDAQEKMFVEGCVKNNITENQAKEIFKYVEKFAGYGFNKAHAAAYGVISYYTAYLKANYPVEFLTACLNLEMGDQEDINLFIYEAWDNNIKIIPPDVNFSEGLFKINEDNDGKSIIYALGAVRNVTISLGNEIANEVSLRGKFKSIFDFVKRIHCKSISKRSLEGLIKAGCFDSIHQNRRQILEAVPKILSFGNKYHEDKLSNQFSLFDIDSTPDILAEIEDFDHNQRAFYEFDSLGIFITCHPLDYYKEILSQSNIFDISYIKNSMIENVKEIKLAGVIQRKDTRMSPRGRFMILNLADTSSSMDITIYSEDVFKNYANNLAVKSTIIATCSVFKDEESIKLTALKIDSLDDYLEENLDNKEFVINNEETMEKFLNLLKLRKDMTKNQKDIRVKYLFDEKFYVNLKFASKHKFISEDFEFLNNL